jgi:hypothetical protein
MHCQSIERERIPMTKIRSSRDCMMALPVTFLALISVGLSGFYAKSLLGPYEYRLSYRDSAFVFSASLMLVVSASATWSGTLSNGGGPYRFLKRILILLAVLPACYYTWNSLMTPEEPIALAVTAVALATIGAQVLVASRTPKNGGARRSDDPEVRRGY